MQVTPTLKTPRRHLCCLVPTGEWQGPWKLEVLLSLSPDWDPLGTSKQPHKHTLSGIGAEHYGDSCCVTGFLPWP